jgi:uncharacterized membrane protein
MFLLVFFAQLVTWIGKTVLLDMVSAIFISSTIAAKDAWPIGVYVGLALYVTLF